jgi:3-oxoacyl-[acyl-carrier-protein] synthase II
VTVSSACASGTTAVGNAFRSIRSGEIDMAFAGGAEFLADPYGGIFRGFDTAQTLVQADGDYHCANRPFDKKRSGFLFSGGGAAVMVLEEATHARRRGKSPIATVEAYSECCDAFTIMGMAPDGRQIEKMYQALFSSAGCVPEDIDYVNSHGTGTILNDETESIVIDNIFGKKPLVNSTKSLLGHTIGASGALETAVTALSIEDQLVHPCANLDDPIRDLNFVTNARQEHEIEWALNQSFGFGGHIAGLILKKPALP